MQGKVQGQSKGKPQGKLKRQSKGKFFSSFVFLVLLIGSFAGPSRAADIAVTYVNPGTAVVNIRGVLSLADAVRFQRVTATLSHAKVLFHSPGGHAVAGILIGRAIRNKGFSTEVASSNRCASACALAWLGGAPRLMSGGARIGFHGAYGMQGGRAVRHDGANVRVTSYLRQLGLSSRAIAHIVQVSPSSMYWLTPGTARQMGITLGSR